MEAGLLLQTYLKISTYSDPTKIPDDLKLRFKSQLNTIGIWRKTKRNLSDWFSNNLFEREFTYNFKKFSNQIHFEDSYPAIEKIIHQSVKKWPKSDELEVEWTVFFEYLLKARVRFEKVIIELKKLQFQSDFQSKWKLMQEKMLMNCQKNCKPLDDLICYMISANGIELGMIELNEENSVENDQLLTTTSLLNKVLFYENRGLNKSIESRMAHLHQLETLISGFTQIQTTPILLQFYQGSFLANEEQREIFKNILQTRISFERILFSSYVLEVGFLEHYFLIILENTIAKNIISNLNELDQILFQLINPENKVFSKKEIHYPEYDFWELDREERENW